MERYDQISTILSEILTDNPGGMTIVDLSEKTTIHRNVLAKYLKVLEAQGKIEIIRKGSKKIIRLSDRVPSSLLKNITQSPYLVFDRYLNITLVSPNAGQYCPPGGDEEEEIKNKTGFMQTFLNDEIRDALHNAKDGIRSSRTIDIRFNEEPHTYELTIIPVVLDDGRSGSALIIEDITEKNEERLLYELTQLAYDALLEDQIQFVVRFTLDYKIIYTNSVFIKYLNIEEDSLIGTPFIPQYPEESLISFKAEIKAISRDNPLVDLEIRRVVASGDFSWEQWKIRGLFDEKQGNLFGYHAVGLDITGFKRNEQELRLYKNNLETLIEDRTTELRQVNRELHKEVFQRESVEKELVLSKFAMDNAHDLIFLLKPDGKIQYLNQTAQKMIEEPGQETQKNIHDILIQSSRGTTVYPFSADLEEVASSGRAIIKGAILDSRGSQIQVEITISRIEEKGEVIFCCIARDITDRRKAEKDLSIYRNHLEQIIEERTKRLQEEIENRNQSEASLRANEERFRLMVEYSAEAVILYDIHLNRFIDANQRAEALFGYSIVELLIISPDEFFTSDWGDEISLQYEIQDLLHQSLSGDVVECEYPIRSHFGHLVMCEVRFIGLISDDKSLIRIGFIDITRKIRDNSLPQCNADLKKI